jgi:hypothetical protein
LPWNSGKNGPDRGDSVVHARFAGAFAVAPFPLVSGELSGAFEASKREVGAARKVGSEFVSSSEPSSWFTGAARTGGAERAARRARIGSAASGARRGVVTGRAGRWTPNARTPANAAPAAPPRGGSRFRGGEAGRGRAGGSAVAGAWKRRPANGEG